ncbi:MAG: hypothetical protein Q4A31_03810 [Corynebacterium sp.]|uniref:hypothetical protein n=1 Tax=Corynebacterium sp. TaxID=1720 RepID=UPI0026DD069D|nr:hypothetical protein [Corynebacterium sp.]MDO4761030.1 hypothetical protein [Corynebacterium sp.]
MCGKADFSGLSAEVIESLARRVVSDHAVFLAPLVHAAAVRVSMDSVHFADDVLLISPIIESLMSLNDYRGLRHCAATVAQKYENSGDPGCAFDVLWNEAYYYVGLGYRSCSIADPIVSEFSHAKSELLIKQCARLATQYDVAPSYHDDCAQLQEACATMLTDYARSAWLGGVRRGQFVAHHYQLVGEIVPVAPAHRDHDQQRFTTVFTVCDEHAHNHHSPVVRRLWHSAREKLDEALGNTSPDSYEGALDYLCQMCAHLPDSAHTRILIDLLHSYRAALGGDYRQASVYAQQAWMRADSCGEWGLRSQSALLATYALWRNNQPALAVRIALTTTAATISAPHALSLMDLAEVIVAHHPLCVNELESYVVALPHSHFRQRLCALVCTLVRNDTMWAQKFMGYWVESASALSDSESYASAQDASVFQSRYL